MATSVLFLQCVTNFDVLLYMTAAGPFCAVFSCCTVVLRMYSHIQIAFLNIGTHIQSGNGCTLERRRNKEVKGGKLYAQCLGPNTEFRTMDKS